MVKQIRIGEENVIFRSTGALPIIYRELTGREFFKDTMMAQENGEITLAVAWAMYRHGNPDDKVEEAEWLERYDFIELNEALPDIVSMISKEMKETSEAKKKNGE